MSTSMPGKPSRKTPGDLPSERLGRERRGSKTFVLVADGGAAHVFERLPDGRVSPLPEYSRNALAVRAHEAGGDRPGRSFRSPAPTSAARSAMEPPTDPDRLAEERFLAEVLDMLARAHAGKAFVHLYLFAPPGALGFIRKVLPPSLAGALIAAGNRDLTKSGPEDIAAHVLALERKSQSA